MAQVCMILHDEQVICGTISTSSLCTAESVYIMKFILPKVVLFDEDNERSSSSLKLTRSFGTLINIIV
jgi:hypothetical protein